MNHVTDLQTVFFSWKLRSIRKFQIQILCDIRGLRFLRNKMRFWKRSIHIGIVSSWPQNCKICGSSKSIYFSFYQYLLIKNPLLFCQCLSLQKSHRYGYVFKICVWISVFKRKKQFENPILGCRDIKQKRSLIFFGTPCIKIWKKIKFWTWENRTKKLGNRKREIRINRDKRIKAKIGQKKVKLRKIWIFVIILFKNWSTDKSMHNLHVHVKSPKLSQSNYTKYWSNFSSLG